MVNLVNTAGVVTQSYEYDAFGVEQDPDPLDTNHFRYCGEYLDAETGRYYLRARYYDPLIGRFTQRDTHWNTANMIYGDNPQKINEREDKLGLKTYSYAPQITAIVQSGNLYVYGINNPVVFSDQTGEIVVPTAMLIAAAAIIVFGTTGGLIGDNLATANNVTGWERYLYVAIGTAAGSILGYGLAAATPAVGVVSGSATSIAAAEVTHQAVQKTTPVLGQNLTIYLV